MKLYPYKKGDGKIVSHAEGGHRMFWGSFNMGSFSQTEDGSQKVFTL